MFIRLSLDHAPSINDTFQINSNNRGHLANQLLLYDKILIPTIDFGIVPILINWFGPKVFEELIESSSIKFLKRNSLLAYSGNGIGISGLMVTPSPDSKFEWWQEALISDVEKSIELQLSNSYPSVNRNLKSNFVNKIKNVTEEIEFDQKFFMDNVVVETYRDISESSHILALVKALYKGHDSYIDLRKLEDVAPNQVKFFGQDVVIRDIVDIVLNVAYTNTLLAMSIKAKDNSDIFTIPWAEHMLKGKLARVGIDQTYIESFTSLLELNNIPDISIAVSENTIHLSELWDIRNKKNSIQFRQWIRNANPSDARELEKLYVDALGKKSFVDSLPGKVIRFIITSTIGWLYPPAALVTKITDSFFTSKLLSGYNPKLFINELFNVVNKK